MFLSKNNKRTDLGSFRANLNSGAFLWRSAKILAGWLFCFGDKFQFHPSVHVAERLIARAVKLNARESAIVA